MFFEQLFKLIFNKIDHFGVLDHVHLVKEDDDLVDTDLSTEKNVLLGLWHGAIGGGNDKNTSIHLGSTGDHVLDVIDVTGTVDVGLG